MNGPPHPCASARVYLRAATRSGHDAAEAALGFDGPLTLEVHRRALAVFLGVFEAVEQVLGRWEASHQGAWIVEPRSALAEADLRRLPAGTVEMRAMSPWPVSAPLDGASGAAEGLGYAYALEGSRLGAAVVAKRIATDRPGDPSSFFAAADPDRWQAFTAGLDATLVDGPLRERAAVAARSVFAELVSQAERSRLG